MRSSVICGLAALVPLVLAGRPVLAGPPLPAKFAATNQSPFSYGTILTSLDNAHFARDAGFSVMSAYVSWSSVEPQRGQFRFDQRDRFGQPSPNDLTNVVNAARGNGLKVGLRLDAPPAWAGGAVSRVNPADVEDYVYHAVRYAAGSIAYIEVFNELNTPLEWGATPTDPAAYARILAGAYRGAHRADPNVVVVSAAPSQRTGGLGGTMEDVDWLNGLYNAGGGAFFDALGVHAYIGNQNPTVDPTCKPMCFRDLELYRGVMERHGDAGKPALITELGALEQTSVDLGQYSWMKLPSEVRAQYLVQALHMARTQYTWLMGATVFNLDYAASNLPNGSERPWFSLLNPDKTPRPAYLWIKSARASGYLPA